MKINIYGSTGVIGTKSLNIISKYFPNIKINLLCANNNYQKLIKQSNLYKPKYVYLHNEKKINFLKNKINKNIKILNFNELKSYLLNSKSDFSILAISGYKSLYYFEYILKNTSSLGLVNKEIIVSAGHLFKNYTKKNLNKIFPLDSEHFSIHHHFQNNKFLKFKKIFLTASGGPFLGKKFFNLKNVTFNEAKNHPKWKMGYKNSIDSATLTNKCLELIEAHYLFNISYSNLDILIHPESQIHSIIEYENYIYNMISFEPDMFIPIFHFLNQKFKIQLNYQNLSIKKNFNNNFIDVKFDEFPVYKFFCKLDKTDPSNVIKFNLSNEYAVNLFKKNMINYTDIYRIITKFTSLNLKYNLNNINNIISYHELLEVKINEFKY